MKRNPRVVACVLTWNDKAAALKCVSSLLRSTYAPLDVVLVDNASNDGTAAAAKRAFGRNKRFTLLQNDGNYGYVANNVGVRHALSKNADYIAIFNNDTIVEPRAIELLVKAAQKHPDAAAISPLIVLADGSNRVWSAGTSFNPIIFKATLIGRGANASEFSGREREVPLAVGAALLMRPSAIRKVGLLDEKYFIYNEETKWELQMKAAGYKFYLEPAARVMHAVGEAFGGGETAGATYYLVRNRGYLINDLCPFYLKPIAYASLVGETAYRAVRGMLVGKPALSKAALEGFGHFILGISGRRPGTK